MLLNHETNVSNIQWEFRSPLGTSNVRMEMRWMFFIQRRIEAYSYPSCLNLPLSIDIAKRLTEHCNNCVGKHA